MTHEIEILDGVAQMAWAGEETPWHRLGTRVSNKMSPTEIQAASGLDWSVEKKPLFMQGDNDELIVTKKEALVRSSDNSILTYVGSGWNPVQNNEAFDFFVDFVEAGDMEMHTAGSLKNGQIVWALAKTKEGFTLAGGDEVESYLLFSNPHQFGKAVSVRFTPIRVVCNNTLTFALNSESSASTTSNHRTLFDAEKVKETLGIASYKMDEYRQLSELLSTKRANKEDIVEYFERIFPITSNDSKKTTSRNAKLALESLESQPGAEMSEGTWWSALNAATYITDHKIGRSVDSRLTSAWFGAGANNKIKALYLAKEYAQAA